MGHAPGWVGLRRIVDLGGESVRVGDEISSLATHNTQLAA